MLHNMCLCWLDCCCCLHIFITFMHYYFKFFFLSLYLWFYVLTLLYCCWKRREGLLLGLTTREGEENMRATGKVLLPACCAHNFCRALPYAHARAICCAHLMLPRNNTAAAFVFSFTATHCLDPTPCTTLFVARITISFCTYGRSYNI